MGRFISRDPSGQEKNFYLYGNGNPIRFTDPTGLLYISPDYEKIFKAIVESSRKIYGKNGSSRNCSINLDDGQYSTDTIDDLFTDYICEYGKSIREFDYDDPITIEVAKSTSVSKQRAKFYFRGGNRYTGFGEKMGAMAFIDAKIFDLVNGYTETDFGGFNNIPLTVMDYIGGYDWIISRTTRGTVHFTIMDEKNLVSGTRFPFLGDNGTKEISMEDYLSNPQQYNLDRSSTIDPYLFDWGKYTIISVLSNKPSGMRDPLKLSGVGGGTMKLIFSWEENFVDSWACPELFINPMYGGLVITQLPIPNSILLPSKGSE